MSRIATMHYARPAATAAPDPRARPDRGARLLELGLALILITAPLPFGAVVPEGRAYLEIASLTLLVGWALRSFHRPTPLPPVVVRAGMAGLLLFAVVQCLPFGTLVVGAVSPGAIEITRQVDPGSGVAGTEARMLGVDPRTLDPPQSLSLDAEATASAVRTGAALVALLLVSTTVVACCGARGLALALLVSAAFQGLYGLLSVASGHDRIWHAPKEYFLGSATGTFVNRNHFACLLAMSLACGLGLVLDRWSTRRLPSGSDRGRVWLMGLGLLVGAAGLLLSHSRAGIAFGAIALVIVAAAPGAAGSRTRLRVAVALVILVAATIPLVQLGAGPLLERYGSVADELTGARAQVLVDTTSIVARFPLVGSGFGSFAATYPTVRSPEVRQFFAHVHNDPLQVLAEGGLVGAALWLMVLLPIAGRQLVALAGAAGPVGVGFAAALAAFLLHGLVDFNGHIPANAATAAIVSGAILGLTWKRTS